MGKDKEAMEEDYHKALKQIFAYGYECCAFKHIICGDQPGIPNGMPNSTNPLPPEFFANLGCPSAPTTIGTKVAKVHLGEVAKDPMDDAFVEE